MQGVRSSLPSSTFFPVPSPPCFSPVCEHSTHQHLVDRGVTFGNRYPGRCELCELCEHIVNITEVIQVSPQERMSERTIEQTVDVPVSQTVGVRILEEIQHRFGQLRGLRALDQISDTSIFAGSEGTREVFTRFSQDRVQQLTTSLIYKCDVEFRRDLYANVVFPGGTAIFQGIGEHRNPTSLQTETSPLLSSNASVAVPTSRREGQIDCGHGPTSSQRETSSLLAPNASVARMYCSIQAQRRILFVMSQRNVCYIVFSSRHRARDLLRYWKETAPYKNVAYFLP